MPCQSQPGLPGRPELPLLVQPSQLKTRAVGTREGRAGLIHALTHIEANAINLALDMVWRFAGMPDDFYMDWWHVAQEEALHFELLHAHLNEHGLCLWRLPRPRRLVGHGRAHQGRCAGAPGAGAAHAGSARPGRHAGGAQPAGVGGRPGARPKFWTSSCATKSGHVAIGNRWYRYLCEQRQLDPVATYAALAQRYQAPLLKGPFNLAARRAAGFTEAELSALSEPIRVATT